MKHFLLVFPQWKWKVFLPIFPTDKLVENDVFKSNFSIGKIFNLTAYFPSRKISYFSDTFSLVLNILFFQVAEWHNPFSHKIFQQEKCVRKM